MTRSLRLHEDADLEMNDAADYYDRESPGLGSVFLDEVDDGFAHIRSHPCAGSELGDGVRRLVLGRFPYALVYQTRGNDIRVLAVAHQRKRPYYWRGRS